MGLFNFIKTAGAKLFGKEGTNPAWANADGNPAMSAEEMDMAKADELLGAVHKYDLKIDSLYVAVEGDKATIAGTAADIATKEKAILVVGNVEGIAVVDDQIKLDTAGQSKFHTVVSGDSLSKIAGEYYGDVMKYPVIFEANKPMLDHPDKIYPGQVLRIPPMA